MADRTENDIKVNNFVVFGTINCRRMERVAICFKQYLSDLGKKFLLTPEAEDKETSAGKLKVKT